MALVITVSYSVNHPEVLPTDDADVPPAAAPPNEQTNNDPPLQLLGSAGGSSKKPAKYRSPTDANALSDEEMKLAVAAGRAAIAARRAADSATRPLPAPSPNSRHQYAVSTSSRADELALTGLAEIAATKKIENARSFMGKPSSFGSYLDGGWSTDDFCVNGLFVRCPVYAAKYRRFDGSCNDPLQRGMAFTPYKRVLPPDYADGIDAPRTGKFGNPLPSAREVSLKVHAPAPSSNPSFTVMLAVFGQFLDHDVTATAISQGTNGSSLTCCPPNGGSHPECFPVRVGPGDPVFDLTETSCLEFARSAPAPQCKIGPRQQLNQVTSFIDGSTIYGSDVDTAESLRSFAGGRLRMQVTPDNRQLLPASTNPLDGCNRELELSRGRYCFASGDARANENLHLTTMHLLWARQHNLLAEQLGQINPQWDDETVYQESRRIVGAQMQHITYNEFLPIVLGEAEMKRRALGPLKEGFRPKNASEVDPAIANHFAAAAFRFAHTLLPGLMKVTDKEKGTSSYIQLHKMLFNPYSLYAEGGVESSITSATSNTIQKTSTHVTSQLTAHLFEDPLGNKTVPCGLDLVSLNIQRGRDHGLPGYTKWREHCGLSKPLKFDDLKGDADPEALDSISKLYDNVDDVDLYTGALAELPKGDGLLGPTFTCLIGNQFERLQQGDRFWYEFAEESGSFDQDQLKELRKTSLARIICDTSDGITEVQSRVMRSIGPDNPMMSCEDIPKVSLTAWKTQMPLLALSETEVPMEDWLAFKSDVNKTITDVVANIMSKKPLPGSLPADWAAFRDDINKTFTDLKDKFAALHPKAMTNVSLSAKLGEPGDFDWVGIKDDVDKAVSDIMDSIGANKPLPGSPPEDWLAFRKKINDSLIDVRKKFKILHPKLKETQKPVSDKIKVSDIPSIDWDEIKNSINTTISDIVSSINASKPLPGSAPEAWFAFRKKINDSIAGFKGKFMKLKEGVPTQITLTKFADGPPPFLPPAATFDWVAFRDQLNKTLGDMIASVVAERPSAGITPDYWLNFEKEINMTFTQIMDQFKDIRAKSMNGGGESANKYDYSKKYDYPKKPDQNVNRTITDIMAEINANRPSPGSPQEDWLIFRQKMNNTFASMKKKYAYLYPRVTSTNILKLSEPGADATFDAVGFKENLNKSLTDLIDYIKAKKPGIDSPPTDWLAYKKDIKDSFSKIKDQVATFKTKQLMEPDYVLYATENDPMFDQEEWNKTIDDISNEIKTILPNDDSMPMMNLQSYVAKSLNNLKNSIAGMSAQKTSKFRLMALVNDDWQNFKDRINTTIEDTLDDIVSNKPAPGDPAWVNYNIYIRNRFAQMKDDVNAIKTEWLEKVKAATEMMTVTNLAPAASSAFSMKVKLISTEYGMISIVLTVALLIVN